MIERKIRIVEMRAVKYAGEVIIKSLKNSEKPMGGGGYIDRECFKINLVTQTHKLLNQ